jgi:hypothetical protein
MKWFPGAWQNSSARVPPSLFRIWSSGIARVAVLTHYGGVPKIFEKEGYIFFFYGNEHAPIHVHVRKGGGEAVFAMEDGVSLRESDGFKLAELSRAEALAESHKELIIRAWHEHFDRP